MPREIVLTEAVNATRERVFRVASDIPNAASFIEGIAKIEILTPGPVGAGTRWIETRRMMGKEVAVELAITHFAAPSTLTIACASGGAEYTTRFDFREDAPQKTTIEMRTGVTARGFMARLMAGMMAGAMRRALAHDLGCIRKRAEAPE